MIISENEIMELDEFKNDNPHDIKRKLSALEDFVRRYTNNLFINKAGRFVAPSHNNILYGTSPLINEGDTVYICESDNEGVYTVSKIDGDNTIIACRMLDEERNAVYKVEYPDAIVCGVIELLKWDKLNRQKYGTVQSESISRHSVTYRDGGDTNGYPVSLLGFMKPYIKARF